MVNPLKQKIIKMIQASGPLTLAQYMAQALSDPDYGYYFQNLPFGREGDFITAPDISQVFGELIGVWCVQTWQNMGLPSKFNLIELGPGRGTMMADILRSTANQPDFYNALSVRMVETSPKLRDCQRQTLDTFNTDIGWVASLDELGKYPSIFLGNEFFDALPIQQYIKQHGDWHERLVTEKNGHLEFSLCQTSMDRHLLPSKYMLQDAPEGAIYEYSEAMQTIASHIGQVLSSGQQGAGLFIDYGYLEDSFGETLQAVRHHQYCHCLHEPGLSDLTSHVKFSALKAEFEAHGLNVPGLLTQEQFLRSLGIDLRFERLIEKHPDKVQKLSQDLRRLIAKSEMGSLFKVLMVGTNDLPLFPFA